MRESFHVQLLANHWSRNMRGGFVLNSLPFLSARAMEVCVQDRFILSAGDHTGEEARGVFMVKI